MFNGKKQKGQALVEFAIILPIVILVLMAILEFGIMLNTYLKIENAAREGARAGIVGKSYTEIGTLVTTISPSLNSSKMSVVITPTEAQRKSGGTLTVKVNYNYETMLPIISSIIGDSIILRSETSMRIE
jgi:Flp pilus assembly protein TadG